MQYKVPYLGGRDLCGRSAVVSVPGSKSITNRALLLAALAKGKSHLSGILLSDDSRHLISCLKELGFSLSLNEEARTVDICGEGGTLPKKQASLCVGSAGTAARFLTALTALSGGEYRIDASEQMRRRPMKPLLDTLKNAGAEFVFFGEENCFPFLVKGAGQAKKADGLSVNIDESSQFLSALMIAAGISDTPVRIGITGSHGMSYIRMTAKMMESFGVPVKAEAEAVLTGGGNGYIAREYPVEADASAAGYFFALAAVTGSSVTVKGISRNSLQGDVAFADLLERMGCAVTELPEGLQVKGPGPGKLKGISADMHSFSDQAITLAALAPFADSPVTITGIGHIRRQESNRIAAMAAELSRMGIRAEELPDGITISPGKPQPALIRTYDDHRMAMGFALTGLMAEGIVIDDPLCCRKTFEDYFLVLEGAIDALTR